MGSFEGESGIYCICITWAMKLFNTKSNPLFVAQQ